MFLLNCLLFLPVCTVISPFNKNGWMTQKYFIEDKSVIKNKRYAQIKL